MILSYREHMIPSNIKNRWVIVVVSLMACTMVTVSTASEISSNKGKRIISIEYLDPIKDDRDIKTINVDVNYLISNAEKLNLSIYFGLAGTYVTGSIIQLEGDLSAGTLRDVQYDNSAVGLGPGLLASFRLFDRNKLSIHLNGSGHILVYNKEFPAGGDYYNFMWRGGPVLEYKIGQSKSIGVSYHWAHVSNGQGVAPRNPSYEAQGLGVRFTGFF